MRRCCSTRPRRRCFTIAEAGARGQQGFIKIHPLLTEIVERIDMLYSRENKNDVIGLATGFADLDRMTSGLQPGELVVVAGRPSMGKTALAMNIAEHVALDIENAGGGVQHGNVGHRSWPCA